MEHAHRRNVISAVDSRHGTGEKMDLEKIWQKALSNTEIIRPRVQGLMTFSDTNVPYILLSESSINVGDTVVRKGEVVVKRPALILPPNNPQFSGFDFEKDVAQENQFINFLLVRGINIPSLGYNNRTDSLDIFEGKLSKAIDHYQQELQMKENVYSGLVAGPEDCWQFSILIFICSQIFKNAQTDLRNLLDEHKKNHL